MIEITYLIFSVDLLCQHFSDRIHFVKAITDNRPWKRASYFHTGEIFPPGAKGSNVAIYLALSYSYKSN